MKCFIDCGTNLGQGLNHFNTKYTLFNNSEWHIYTFEANPNINIQQLFSHVQNITFFNKAIWIENTTLEFRSQGNDKSLTGEGSKIEQVHKLCNPTNVQYKIMQTQAINFSEFLNTIKSQYSKIIVKMDIEGAEIDVLNHCINKNTIQYIDELYVELHERFNYVRDEHHKKQNEIEEKENEYIELYKKYIPTVIKWA